MRNINYSNRKGICYVCVVIVLWTLGVHAATLPPDPDNAALLYYQAFLLRPKPDAATLLMLNNVLRGAEPDEKIREYLNLKDCRDTIEYAETAAQMPKCNWGIRYSQGYGYRLTKMLSNLRSLAQLLFADARLQAFDGDYQAALYQCLKIRRLAGHIGDDTNLLYLVSLSVDGLAQRCIQQVLGSMIPDEKTLMWLQGQLTAVQGAPQSPARALEIDLELILQTMRSDPDTLTWIREQIIENAEDPPEIQNLTDEDLLARAREPYISFLNSVFRVMDSNMSYEQKYAEIQSLTNKLNEEYGSDPAAGYVMFSSGGGNIVKVYSLHVRHIAQFNALKAAIEIYIVIAKTGQLPETLPDYLPKDPYSGQDFEYEITEEGFVLRCRGEDLSESVCPLPLPGEDIDSCKFHQYEFKVQR